MYTLSFGYVPVDGSAQHLQGYQIGEGFTLLNRSSTHSETEIAQTFGL